MPVTTAALLGATGGAGTTRTCLELASALAVDGDDVAVLDVAFDTQGLARHLGGRLDPDLTALLTDEAERALDDGLVEFDPLGGTAALADVETASVGRVACCPARAPFARLARAKTTEAAQAFEDRLSKAEETFDHVLIDTPPLGSNPAVAAVTAADRVGVVAPATAHGADAVQLQRGRLQDVGATADAVVAVDHLQHGGAFADTDADAIVPAFEGEPPAALASAEGVGAVADVAAAVLERPLDLPVAEPGLVERVTSLR